MDHHLVFWRLWTYFLVKQKEIWIKQNAIWMYFYKMPFELNKVAFELNKMAFEYTFSLNGTNVYLKPSQN